MAPARARNSKGTDRPAAARRGGAPTALADSLRQVTQKALGHRSLAEQNLILDWPSIAGSDIAALCLPKAISFPHRGRRIEGTLSLTVSSGQATRLQHLEPQLIERINGYFGYRAVARLRLLHGAAANPQAAGPGPAESGDGAPGRDEGSDPSIDDPALRAALARLRRAVKSAS